ncbi:hypothetical protein PRK78_000139 [Emydomyces testavorans]|uniref:Uncharacterized protein n=1 Tax=Emydomyces testavorans TaxID=2070801 RepID=A0AAF0IFJ4_9EURO|nr:hypothetical protein PRK78_000139 [Emydomyces testavorans]
MSKADIPSTGATRQSGNWYQGRTNKKVKARLRDKVYPSFSPMLAVDLTVKKDKRTRKQADSYGSNSHMAHRWDNSKDILGLNAFDHESVQDGYNNSVVKGDGYNWSAGYIGYHSHDNDNIVYDESNLAYASYQQHYCYYPVNPWYGYWPYDTYAPMTSNGEFEAPTATAEAFRLRAEAPEFIPAGQPFPSSDLDVASHIDAPAQTDATSVVKDAAEAPIYKRYATI